MSLTLQQPEDDTVVCVLRSLNNETAYLNQSSIVHQMSQPYKFPTQMYEVGLRKFTYFPNERQVTGSRVRRGQRKKSRVVKKKVKFHEKMPSPGPFFPGYRPPQVVKTVPVIKQEKEDLYQFRNRFNEHIGPVVNMSLFLKSGVFLIEFNPSDVEEILILSPALAQLLGHRRQQFHTGRYVGNDVMTDDYYKNLSVNTELTISIVKFPYKGSMITLHQQFDALRSFKKQNISYEEFFQYVSSEVARDGYELSFTFDQNKKVTITVNVTAVTDPRNHVVLPLEIRDCLGFQREKFPVGTYRSQVPINVTKYTAIPADKTLFFRFYAYSWLYQEMKEPKSLYVKDVVDELNQSFKNLRSQEFTIEFYYDDGHLRVFDIPPDVEMTLPKPLASYFGIPEETKIRNGSRIPLASEIVYEEDEIEYLDENPTTSAAGEATRLLICCELVKEMPYGKRLVNLLREIPLFYDVDTEVEHIFNPIQYLPLNTSIVNEIRINYLDEDLRPVEFTNKATSVTLEFRRKF